MAAIETEADFAAYRPRQADPLCRPYRIYVVCVPPPPSSGVALLQLLAILEQTDIAKRGPDDPQAWFLFAEASRLMYADRDRYVADPAFVAVPVTGLLDPGYVVSRASLIGERAGPAPVAGTPPGIAAATFGDDSTREVAGTSHFVVVDAEGDVVSMTTTVESVFGSGRAVRGFFLNNQLTDFSYRPVEDGRPVANAVAPGKRPRSSMAPVLVLDRDGRLVAALGSPGGTAILGYNAKALVGLLAWNLPLQQAIELPNLIARGKDFFGEAGKFPPAVLAGLAARGVKLAVISNWDRRLPRILRGLDLEDRFDVVTVSSLAGVEKPAAEIFTRTLDRLGVAADRALHVGDSPLEDYSGAENAGLAAALIDRSGAFSGQPYRRIAGLAEVLELVG